MARERLPVSEVPDEDMKGREADDDDEGQFFIRSSRAFSKREGELVPLQSKADAHTHSVRHPD